MFVLVVDTSLMNVSISAVVKDLDTKVSAVQSAIALEAPTRFRFRATTGTSLGAACAPQGGAAAITLFG